jgi:hypothetical protein
MPCNREFPYIEKLLRKYGKHGFSVLVINTSPGGADNASALVRKLGYSFKLAHAPAGWKHAMGRGANFIIDQQGRVVFRPDFNGPRDLKTADRLIAGLLRRGSLRSGATQARAAMARKGMTGA